MATLRRSAQDDSKYFLRFAATATLLVSGTLVLVFYVLPQRYVLSSGFREGSFALPDPSIPFEPADPMVIAALPPLPPPTEIIRGPGELFWEQALPLLEQERLDESIPLFAAYLANYPDDLDVRREYGVTLLRAGYGARAVPVLESLLLFEDDRELHLLLARTLRDIGDVSGATVHYEAVVGETPADETMVLEWARAHMGIEEYAEAERILVEGLEARPESVPIRIELARIYFYTDRLVEAEEILLAMSDTDLASADALQLREDVITALTPPPEPEVEPAPPPTLIEQAIGAREDGLFTRAAELYEAALAESPDDVEAWQAYADFLQYELSDFEGALSALGEIERITGGRQIDLQYRMAQLEVWIDQPDAARERLEGLLLLMDEEDAARATGAVPDGSTDSYIDVVTRADVLALLGDLDRWNGARLPAAGRYEAALVLDPTHERSLEGLAILQAEVDRQMVEIEEPGIGAIVESLADTDDFRRLDLGGEWYGISQDWVWGTRSGARLLEGLETGGGAGNTRGAFAELEGARWWRWGTIRTALHFGVQNVRESELDVSFGASGRFLGAAGRRTEIRIDHAPAFGVTNTLQAVRADVQQDRLFVAHAQPLNELWSLAVTGEGASLSHGGVPGAGRNLRVSLGASAGRMMSRTVTLGLGARGLRYMDASPSVGAGALYWDPNSSVSVGPYAQYARPLGTWWTLNARVNPGVAWIDERSVPGGELVPDLSVSLGLRREGARYLTRIDLLYGQGRFTGYRSFGVNVGFSARGWLGRAGQGGTR